MNVQEKQRDNFKLLVFIAFAVFFGFNLLITYNLSADTKIPKVKLSVKPFDLSKAPSNEKLMAAGQLGGQLYPTHEVKDKDKEKKFNLSFGKAIQEWNKHNYKNAVKLFKKYIEDNPTARGYQRLCFI